MSESVNCTWITPTIMSDRIDSNFYKKEDIENLNKIYKSKMQVKSLIDIANDIKDGPHDGYTFVDDGVLFIRSQNIKDAGFDLTDKKYITKEFHEKFKKSWLEVGDLLITRIGEYYGNAAVVSSEYKGCNINHAIAKIKLKKEYNPYYICAYVNSSIGNKIYRRLGKSFTSPRVNLNDYSDFIIPIPSPEIQKYIGDKVRKAEELREEAKRLKKEAEEILNAELKLSYFNERVKDAPKIYNWIYGESIEIRIDSQYYINETNFINNEMYKKGLKLKRISEIANVGKGFSYTSLDNKSIPYIRISDLDDLLINFDTAELVDEKTYSEKKSSQLEKYDLIFAITGATIGKVSLFYNSKYSKATLSSDTAFVRLKDKNDAAYVLLYLKSFIGQLGILKGVTGATNRHLSLEHIGDIFIPVIDNKLKQEINMRVIKAIDNVYLSKQLIKEAKQDVEDLIEGNFDMSKVKANS